MTTTHNTTTTPNEYAIKVRCGGRTYTETVHTYNAETAWGHSLRIETQYERDYGYNARIISVREINR